MCDLCAFKMVTTKTIFIIALNHRLFYLAAASVIAENEWEKRWSQKAVSGSANGVFVTC